MVLIFLDSQLLPIHRILFKLMDSELSMQQKLITLLANIVHYMAHPFDLEELSSQSGLDINKITHVKIIDVVGCIQANYATYDQYQNIINDPWNTPYPSGGFDLDAVGVIHQDNSGEINELSKSVSQFEVFPNPIDNLSVIKYYLNESLPIKIVISDVLGKQNFVLIDQKEDKGLHTIKLNNINLTNGIYFVKLLTTKGNLVKIIMSNNE